MAPAAVRAAMAAAASAWLGLVQTLDVLAVPLARLFAQAWCLAAHRFAYASFGRLSQKDCPAAHRFAYASFDRLSQ